MESLSNRRRKEIAKLTQRKYRKERGETLLETVRTIRSAIQGGADLRYLVVSADGRGAPAVAEVLDALDDDVPVYTTDADTMAKIVDVHSAQGMVAVAATRYVEADALPDRLGADGRVLLLDGVQDPGNVGTILRTASWFGADAVVAGANTAGLFHPKVMRAGAGGQWDVHCARTDDLGGLIDRLRRDGYAIHGADMEGVPIEGWQPSRPSALVLGSEAHGLSPDVRDRLDVPVYLPGVVGRPSTQSLNVAVAAGILVYEWLG